jgi:uncharacterized protein (DUF305 family)
MSAPRRLVVSGRVLTSAAIAIGAVGLGVFLATRPDPQPRDQSTTTRVVQPGAPGQPGRTLSADELASISPPRHTTADTLFMQRMIRHHAQALEMTALVADRTSSRDVSLLAQRIEASQREEIAQMQRWLTERGESTHVDHAGHDLMPGMLTDEQLDQLEKARGPEFDRLFLEFMIRHHEGALAMVQELYAAGGGVEPASDRFAREVNADQNIEISRMRHMLAAMS